MVCIWYENVTFIKITQKNRNKIFGCNNWSNLIHCNWLKLRNFINTQWNIRFTTSKPLSSKLAAYIKYKWCMCDWMCVCVNTRHGEKKLYAIGKLNKSCSIVICNWISFFECNEMKNADCNPYCFVRKLQMCGFWMHFHTNVIASDWFGREKNRLSKFLISLIFDFLPTAHTHSMFVISSIRKDKFWKWQRNLNFRDTIPMQSTE